MRTFEQETRAQVLADIRRTEEEPSATPHALSNSGRPRELHNDNNGCYLNAVVQCIACIDIFADMFKGSSSLPVPCPQLVNMETVLTHVNNVAVVNAVRLEIAKKSMRAVMREGTSPQDVGEFFQTIADTWHSEQCQRPIDQLFTVLTSGDREDEVRVLEPILRLPIIGANQTLKDCFQKWQNCNEYLLRLPPVLIIHLNRSVDPSPMDRSMDRGSVAKNMQHVAFEMQMDLKEFLHPRFVEDPINTSSKYTLHGVTEHRGTFDGGHYFSYTRRGDKWYLIDDTNISEVTPAHVQEPHPAQVSMLWYVRDDSAQLIPVAQGPAAAAGISNGVAIEPVPESEMDEHIKFDHQTFPKQACVARVSSVPKHAKKRQRKSHKMEPLQVL
jgi:ubiquitin C-terminal hydrolase